MAARPGFEPRQTEPESVVLPLHHRAEYRQYTSIFAEIKPGNKKKSEKMRKIPDEA